MNAEKQLLHFSFKLWGTIETGVLGPVIYYHKGGRKWGWRGGGGGGVGRIFCRTVGV